MEEGKSITPFIDNLVTSELGKNFLVKDFIEFFFWPPSILFLLYYTPSMSSASFIKKCSNSVICQPRGPEIEKG